MTENNKNKINAPKIIVTFFQTSEKFISNKFISLIALTEYVNGITFETNFIDECIVSGWNKKVVRINMEKKTRLAT